MESGYIKLVCADPPVVFEPPPAAVSWLRTMLAPLVLRPFLTIEMVSILESIPVREVPRLCLAYDIPIQHDPAFGEVMTVTAFYQFHSQLHHYREPSRFDRQAMILALMQAADPERYKHDFKAPAFSKRLEAEVRRISRMAEPQRTEMALRLWESYEDGKSVAECLLAARGKSAAPMRTMDRIQAIVEPKSQTAPRRTPSGCCS